MAFKDHFSSQSAAYGRFRPHYPASLFAFLSERCASHERAWDCATGNGQAALGLVKHFAEIVATDASENQIAHAIPHPQVHYRIAKAEASGLEAESVDLITVAQAYHWFQHQAFSQEVARVLKPGGYFACWLYVNFKSNEAIDKVRDFWYDGPLAEYWPSERQLVDSHYATLPFPFHAQKYNQIQMRADWDLETLVGYIETWSAVARYKKLRGEDPIPAIRADFKKAMGGAKTVPLSWEMPLFLAQKPVVA